MFTVHFLRLNLDIILAEEIFKSPIYQSFPHLNVLLGKSISLKCSWNLWQFSKSESWSREDFVLEMTTWCDFFFKIIYQTCWAIPERSSALVFGSFPGRHKMLLRTSGKFKLMLGVLFFLWKMEVHWRIIHCIWSLIITYNSYHNISPKSWDSPMNNDVQI